MAGIPVVIATNGYGMAVKAVTGNAPTMTVATNGYGTPIVLSDNGAPFVVEGTVGPSYEPEAIALFARYTGTPTSADKDRINAVIKSYKDNGLWDKRDSIWIIANFDAQASQQNLKADAFNLTPVSSPVFTAYRGYKGDGSGSHLNTGHLMAGAGAFQQDDGSFFGWTVATVSDIASAAAFFGRITSVITFMRPRSLTSTLEGRLQSGSTFSYGSTATRLGSRALSRLGTLVTGFVNGASNGSNTMVSAALVSEALLIGRLQTTYSSDTWGFASVGGRLTDAEHAIEHSIAQTYLQAVGAV